MTGSKIFAMIIGAIAGSLSVDVFTLMQLIVIGLVAVSAAIYFSD